MENSNSEIPFTSYLDLLSTDTLGFPHEAQSGSQETHNSSQGFVSGLANDEELFGGIKPDEDLKNIFEQQQPTSLQIPLSPGSTVSVESMDTIVDLMDGGRLSTDATKEVYTAAIKEELKYKVKLHQMERGIDPDEVAASWKREKTVSEKSPESLLKMEERKMKNRIAARKCRMKKRRSEEMLKEEMNRLMEENANLRQKVRQNRQGYDCLLAAINNHFCVGNVRPASPDLSC